MFFVSGQRAAAHRQRWRRAATLAAIVSALAVENGRTADANPDAEAASTSANLGGRVKGPAILSQKPHAPGRFLLPTWGEATTKSRSRSTGPKGVSGDARPSPTSSAGPTIAVTVTPPVVPPPAQVFPVDLTTALRLAEVENPEIALARQRILEAAALRQAAYALLIPTLNAGFSYHGHDGNLQRSSGHTLAVSQQAIYAGGGTFASASNPVTIPAVTISSALADAIFEPLAARQNVARTEFDARATANTILLDVSTLYFDLVGAYTTLQFWQQTEAEANEIARLTAAYARSGEGFTSDADRARTLSRLIHRSVEQSEELAAVASTRLSMRLHLDPAVRVLPSVPGVAPISLIDPSSSVEDLIRTALQGRPEMGARAAAIGVAETRLSQEIARPLLPTVWLGFSGGVLGGGSNLVEPSVGNFRGRTDFDVRLFWTLQNVGLGNLALQKQRRASIGQAIGEQSRTINLIRREVASAKALVIAAQRRMEATKHQLQTSEEGFRQDLDRLQNTVGRPIEMTNSLELLAQARIDHLLAIINYNQAQLRLFVSLGTPPPLERPATDPLPPAPVAAPPLPLAPVR